MHEFLFVSYLAFCTEHVKKVYDFPLIRFAKFFNEIDDIASTILINQNSYICLFPGYELFDLQIEVNL